MLTHAGVLLAASMARTPEPREKQSEGVGTKLSSVTMKPCVPLVPT